MEARVPQAAPRAGARGRPRERSRNPRDPAPRSARSPRAALAAPALALVAALVLHARSIRAPFFADDWLFLDLVRSRSLLAALTAPDPIGNFARPLGRALWFWVLARAGGESALPFHAANLALFAGIVVATWALARERAGPRAAAVAAALVALTQAADVPVRWAAGSQDLLATLLALLGVLALTRGRGWIAAALLVAAPLAKEVAALAVLPALLLARAPGESWRASLLRAAPALAGVLAWAVLRAWLGPHTGAGPALAPASLLAALAGAARTLLGLEWAGALAPSPLPALLAPRTLLALALALAAVAAGFARSAPDGATAAPRGGAVTGALAWLLAGALPVALVANIWSAYFYLFAICGGAILAGLALARAPRALALAVVLLLGLGARSAGEQRAFATEPGGWTALSHVNDFYLDRGMSVVSSTIGDLRRLRPAPARGTTFFFAGLPMFAGVQSADGPLVRGVYRDSSLRSYFLLGGFTLDRARRGPAVYLFYIRQTGHLVDRTDDPEVLTRVALGQLFSGNDSAAAEVLQLDRERHGAGEAGEYLSGLVALQRGHTREGLAHLAAAGYRDGGDGTAALRGAEAMLGARDTAGALASLDGVSRAFALDARVHGRVADLLLALPGYHTEGAVEAYAARALAPAEPANWRRWAFALFLQSRMPEAGEALERYFALGGGAALADSQAVALRADLVRMRPGGELMQQALQRDAPGAKR